MKKQLIILSAMLFSGFAFSQVGVNTPDPKANLDVVGTAAGTTLGIRNTAGWDNLWFNATSRYSSINASGAEDGLQFNVGTNVTGIYGDGQTLTTVATLRQNGNFGIGTTNPQNRLDLGASNGAASLTAAAGKKLALFNNSAGSDFYGLGVNTGYLQFHAGAAPTAAPGMVLTTGGNIGVGTTDAPEQRLTVVDAGNSNSVNGIASFLAQNLTQGVGIGWSGISSIGSIPNVNLNLNSKGTGNIIMQSSGTTGNVGIGVVPTAKLDINGTARIRNIDIATGPTLITPVYADGNGVLNKAVNSTYGTVINNSISVTSGATGTLITGLVDGATYKAVVMTRDACLYTILAEYYVTNTSFNSNFSIKGIDGILSTGTTSKGPTFTEINRVTTATVWTGKTACADGGNGGSFNYTLTMPSAGTINITNNGNVNRGYQIILTRLY